MKNMRIFFFFLLWSASSIFIYSAAVSVQPSLKEELQEINSWTEHEKNFFLDPLSKKSGLRHPSGDLMSGNFIVNRLLKGIDPELQTLVRAELPTAKARHEKLAKKLASLSDKSKALILSVVYEKPQEAQDEWVAKTIDRVSKLKWFEDFIEANPPYRYPIISPLMLMPIEKLLTSTKEERDELTAQAAILNAKMEKHYPTEKDIYCEFISPLSAFLDASEREDTPTEKRLSFFNDLFAKKEADEIQRRAEFEPLIKTFKNNPLPTPQPEPKRTPPYFYYGAAATASLAGLNFIVVLRNYYNAKPPVDKNGKVIPFKKYLLTELKNFNPKTLSGALKWAALTTAAGTGICCFYSLYA